MGEITVGLDQPYYGASGAVSSSFGKNVVGLNGRAFLVDSTGGRYNRRSIPVVQQRNTSDQRDILLLPQDIWRQSISSWHYGAGQANQDRDEAFPERFLDSFGVDPWTRYQISLLPATEQLGGSSVTYTGDVFLTLCDDKLVVVNDDDVYIYTTLSDTATPTTTATPDSGNAIIDIAKEGYVITTLHADGKIYKTTSAGTSTLFQTLSGATSLEYVKDYLIVGDANVLKDATGSGTPTTIYTHPDTNYRWVDYTPGQSAIYALGGIGNRYQVHRITIQEDGTAFSTAIVAATLPDGEVGYSIGEYLGFIFIGTNNGIRMASMNSDGSLTLGPKIPTAQPVHCFEGEDRFVWYGNSDIDPKYAALGNEVLPTGVVCGLGRMDLTEFTVGSLSPAYANDLFTSNETGKVVKSVMTFSDKRVFSVNGGGVYFESTNKVPSGWLTQGKMSFSVEDLKAALYMQANWEPGCQGKLYLDIAFDTAGFARYATLDVLSTNNRSDNLALRGTQFSVLDLRFVLDRCSTDATDGPQITRWEFRSSPIKGSASRWEVPIMNYEEIEIDGVKYTRDPTAELEFLMNLVESGTVFTYQESGRSYQVHARDFIWQPEKLSAGNKGWEGTYTMVLEEVR
tara:strand:- start:830 stop:2704 length:1875 start_codon:yes stop_codon:yes gene_type:complete